VDATDPAALAALSLDVLDDLSKMKVVEVDNAVRTSDNELALAVEEFGTDRTALFTPRHLQYQSSSGASFFGSPPTRRRYSGDGGSTTRSADSRHLVRRAGRP
jgi:hypothetical protein